MTKSTTLALETISNFNALTHVLSLEKPVHLVICSNKETHLEYLLQELGRSERDFESASEILRPSLSRLKAGKNIRITYAPSLMHLRAVLSSISTLSSRQTLPIDQSIAKSERPILAILGLPFLHNDENDLNAQSLSRTLALAVEAGDVAGMSLRFLCPRRSRLDCDDNDIIRRNESIWETRVPVLGSVRGEERTWSGRSVMMGHIFRQWCRVVKAPSE